MVKGKGEGEEEEEEGTEIDVKGLRNIIIMASGIHSLFPYFSFSVSLFPSCINFQVFGFKTPITTKEGADTLVWVLGNGFFRYFIRKNNHFVLKVWLFCQIFPNFSLVANLIPNVLTKINTVCFQSVCFSKISPQCFSKN